MNTGAKRILVIPSWYPPDGGHFFQDQAEALADQGYQVDVLVKRMVGLTAIRWRHRYTYRRFGVQAVGSTRVIRSAFLKLPGLEMWNMKRWTRATSRLFGRYDRRFGKPDLMLVHSAMWAGYAAARIRESFGTPYYIVEHRSRFTLTTEAAGPLLKGAYEPFLRRAYAGAELVVTVSDALQSTIGGYLEAAGQEKMLTIPNLVDTNLFKPAGSPGKHVAGKVAARTLLSIARFEYEKGLDLLIAAFARLGGADPTLQLRIIGDGPLRGALERQIRSLDMGQQISLPGKLPPGELVGELQEAACFVLASRYEAFGVVFIEAMATGLPVIASRAGGPPTFIPDFAGKLVDVDDEEQLYLAMKEMLEGLSGYDSHKIRQYTMEHFSREAVAERHASLIRELLDD